MDTLLKNLAYEKLVPSDYDEIEAIAIDVLGDSEKAKSWLDMHNLVLQKSPLEMLKAERDKNEILRILNLIRYGDVISDEQF